MATLTTLVDGTIPVAADFNGNFNALNTEVRTVPYGGTGAATFTAKGIMLGNGTSALAVTAAPTNGQLLIGSTGANPVPAALTAGTGVQTTAGAGTLSVAAAHVVGKASITGDITLATAVAMADATGLTTTITTGANRVLLIWTGRLYHSSTAGTSIYLEFDVDGATQGADMFEYVQQVAGVLGGTRTFVFLTAALTAASHTFKVQWRTTSVAGPSTATMVASAGSPATFQAIEIPV